MNKDIKKLIGEINAKSPHFSGSIRAFRAEGAAEDEPLKFELSFSSEAPYERWFGVEILGHKSEEVNMAWIESGNAPMLLQHDSNRQIGIIESAQIADGRGTAVVRFGRGELAREIMQDVEDGIRRNVSVGYTVEDMQMVSRGSNGAPDTYRVTRWTPQEVSIVANPADKTVGTNRASETAKTEIKTKREGAMNEELKKLAVSLGLSEDASLESVLRAQGDKARKEAKDEAKREDLRKDEIRTAGQTHNLASDAERFIREGKTADDFNRFVMKRYSEGHSPLKQVGDFSPSEQKDLRGFSLLRAMSLLRSGKSLDGIERDVMAMGLDEAARCGIETSGEGRSILVPSMLMRATAMSTSTNAGGEFIPTVTSSNVIDTLRNKMVIGRIGGQVMTGLAGTLKLPRVTTSPSGSSVAEVGALTDATIVTGELEFTPHRVGATLPYSNMLFLQSSPDVNAFVQNQLMLACSLRADYLCLNGDGTTDGHWYGILNYSGIGSVASGDNGKLAALADIIGLETEVAVDNADVGALAYLTSAKGRGILKQTAKVESTDSMMLWSDANLLNGYRAEVSNQVPSNVTKGTETTNTTSIVFGNWNDAILGFFGGMEVIVDPYTLAKKSQTQVTVNMFADFDLQHAQSFAAMDGVHQS